MLLWSHHFSIGKISHLQFFVQQCSSACHSCTEGVHCIGTVASLNAVATAHTPWTCRSKTQMRDSTTYCTGWAEWAAVDGLAAAGPREVGLVLVKRGEPKPRENCQVEELPFFHWHLCTQKPHFQASDHLSGLIRPWGWLWWSRLKVWDLPNHLAPIWSLSVLWSRSYGHQKKSLLGRLY